MKRITAEEAMRLIPEGSTIGITGFIGSAFPEYMAVKIEESFLQNGYPKNITVTHSPGIGSGDGKGMDHFAHMGLLKSVPGIDLQTQVLDQIEFPVKVSKDLKLMDERIFLDKPMGLEI